MSLVEENITVGQEQWIVVAHEDQLEPDRGVAARVGSEQVALFKLSESGEICAIGNFDPFAGINILSRGLVGDRDGEPKVSSPIYKQSFSLRTGICLDDPAVSLPMYAVRVRDGFIEIRRL